MKILKASAFYPAYHRWIYERNPGLKDRSYREQHAFLMADGFASADSWKYYLEKTGRFEVEEVIVNAEWLQKRWADEQGLTYGEASWPEEIFAHQCRVLGGDVLYALDQGVATTVERFLPLFPRRPLVVAFDGIARHDERIVRNCDVIFSCLERSVAHYRALGKEAHYLPHGFDARRAAGLSAVPAEPVDVSFIGSLIVRIGHEERARTLHRIGSEIPLAIWCGQMPDATGLLRSWASYVRHGEWRSALSFAPVAGAVGALRRLDRGQLFGRAMLAQMAASRVTVNIHIAAAETEAANIRLFEATGAGACLVTDWKSNLARFFEPESEIVTFSNRDEAVEKIRYLLDHEEERAAIAQRGRARTLRSHSIEGTILRAGDALRMMLATSNS